MDIIIVVFFSKLTYYIFMIDCIYIILVISFLFSLMTAFSSLFVLFWIKLSVKVDFC